MIDVYKETSLTPLKVAQMSAYTDWSSQPATFKHYPDYLFRYKFGENEKLRFIEDARVVTSKKPIGSKDYYQLNIPSAGNLHPTELYVQIRAIKGVLSGVYHIDTQKGEFVLIQEIESDGIEPCVGLESSFLGVIFILSIVPFRSEWKYGERCIRYCYLDAGHQIGAISASLKLHKQSMTILSDFDKEALNSFMGFRDDEYAVSILACGNLVDKKVNYFNKNLMYVTPMDYSRLSRYLVYNLVQNNILKSEVTHISSDVTIEDIYKRRSARSFKNTNLSEEQLNYFMQLSNNTQHSTSCFNILLKDSSKKAGIYLKDKLIKEGLFADELSKILVEQSFIKNAHMIIVVTSKYFSSNKLMQAGVFVHNLALEAESHKIGSSGIGAFYDEKLQDFLSTDEYILYLCAVGVNP